MNVLVHFGLDFGMENYQVLHLIGEGCFGKVFKGRRKYTGQAVALKFISTRGKSEKDLKNLRQEMAILKPLRHENIILLLDAFETASDFVVVTEFAHGELFEIFQDDRHLPESELKKIARQLVDALHYLHSNRVIHRDMKPQNILIGSNNVIKLCDFGFARSMSNKTVVLNSVKGTPLYMAPELVQEQPYNHCADLWSLGVILYELFVGTPPFYTNSLYSLINLIINDSVKYPDTMSGEFKSFLQGLLQKNPKQRLAWPQLLHHPFIAEERRRQGSQSESDRSGSVTPSGILTPRNCRDIASMMEAGFETIPVDPEVATFCMQTIEACSRRALSETTSKQLTVVVEYLVPFLQHTDRASTAAHAKLLSRSFEMATAFVLIVQAILEEETFASHRILLNQLLRLLGLWVQEFSMERRDSVLVSFFPCASRVLKQPELPAAVNCCKCLSVMFASVGAVGQAFLMKEKWFTQTLATLVGLVCSGGGVAKAAVHALSSSLLIFRMEKSDLPFPWADAAAQSVSTGAVPVVNILASVVKGYSGHPNKPNFITALLDQLLGDPEEIDCAAIQLLHALTSGSLCAEFGPAIMRHLGKNGGIKNFPFLLPAAVPLQGVAVRPQADLITQCQAAGVLANALMGSGRAPWVTQDLCRLVANSLAHPMQPNPPWALAYGVDLLVTMLRLVGEIGDRLAESLVDLLGVVSVEISDFARVEDLRRIEAKCVGPLSRGPLDGIFGLCNFVKSVPPFAASKRVLRGILQSSSGSSIRGVLHLCGPAGLIELAECLSKVGRLCACKNACACILHALLAVLQSVVSISASLPNLGSPTRFAFNLLLDAIGTVLHEAPSPDVEGLAAGVFIPNLITALTSAHFAPPNLSALSVLAILLQAGGPGAASQFVSGKGLQLLCQHKQLLQTPDSAGEVVSIISNIARASPDYYSAIHDQLAPYTDLLTLLNSADGSLRAKTCNAIGNMSRHNDFFYPQFRVLLPALVRACTDAEVNCRKFASFAIGNVAFHSDLLYGDLRSAVPVLVTLLRDEDEKTRANAAGALGNLVRNSNLLVSSMISQGAVEGLLARLNSGAMDSSARIALFSLGNLAMHAASKELLLKCGPLVASIAQKAKRDRDGQTLKYCERLLLKLAQP